MVVPVETSSPAVNIVLSEPVADVTPESVDPWRPQPKPQNEALPTPAWSNNLPLLVGWMSSLVRWFLCRATRWQSWVVFCFSSLASPSWLRLYG